MSKQVEFFFDFGSPTTYLAWTQLPDICEATESKLVYRPFLLGGVFQSTGNSSPVTVPAKGQYTIIDLKRHADMYGVEFVPNRFFPINTLTLMRAAVAIQLYHPERFDDFLKAIFTALWVKGKNLGDIQVLQETLIAAEFDAAEIQEWVGQKEVKDHLMRNTEEAIKRGAFGAPTFYVGDEMFFGQDRLHFVARALDPDVRVSWG